MKSIEKIFSLKGKVAVVTGALGLLGREHARVLAEAGANAVIVDLNEKVCKEFAAEIQNEYDVKCLGIGTDITQKSAVDKMVDSAMSEFGKINILINNAAVNDKFDKSKPAAKYSQFENYPLELWQKSISVNLTGTFLCSQAVGRVMVRQKSGVIINIASTYGMVAPDQRIYQREDGTQDFYKSVSYGVTKAAVINLTKFLAAYWANKNIRVNSLSPGGVFENQDEEFVKKYSRKTTLGRMARKDEYHGAILFLASEASSYMSGANLVVDGGWTIW